VEAGAEATRTETSKDLLRRLVAEFYNERRWELADELVTPDLRLHTHIRPGPEGLAAGAQGLVEMGVWVQTGWPDSTLTIDEVIGEGDRAAARVTIRGSHLGVLHGNPPTRKQAEWSEMFFVHVRDGRVDEIWHELDVLGILQRVEIMPPLWQMGKMPAPLLTAMKLRARLKRRLPGREQSLSSWRANLPPAYRE
jgi:predicted ester cyclase